jgi:ferredoxin
MLVRSDRGKCVGAGSCAALAPAIFDQDDDSGLVQVLNERPAESERNVVEQAVEFCPAQALWVEEE